MILSTELFDSQMAELARRYAVLSLDDVLEHYRERRPFPRRAVHVTFDDGYADNFEHALPILSRHSIPATFFLTTGPIDRRDLLWWDELGSALLALAGQKPSQTEGALQAGPPPLRPILKRIFETPGTPVGLIDHCTRILNDADEFARQETVAALVALAAPYRNGPPRRLMLTWEEVRAMQREGMTMGAHTVNHAYLDELDDATGFREVGQCLERIEQETGVRPRAFSYPAGRTTDRSRNWLDRAGVRLALTTRGGRNRSDEDRFALKRWDGGYLNVDDRFVSAYMRLELSGAVDGALRHRSYG
jgi:peptidoglycan/xylan/chitin deacetylase (PgdA/CDA1 family)